MEPVSASMRIQLPAVISGASGHATSNVVPLVVVLSLYITAAVITLVLLIKIINATAADKALVRKA